MLSVPDEDTLALYAAKAAERGLRRTIFREPDYNNEITAIVIEPGEAASRLCSTLPLALREGVAA